MLCNSVCCISNVASVTERQPLGFFPTKSNPRLRPIFTFRSQNLAAPRICDSLLLGPQRGVPNGRVPNGRGPSGRVPNGQVPNGRGQNGRGQNGRVPNGQVPFLKNKPPQAPSQTQQAGLFDPKPPTLPIWESHMEISSSFLVTSPPPPLMGKQP